MESPLHLLSSVVDCFTVLIEQEGDTDAREELISMRETCVAMVLRKIEETKE